MPLFKYEIQRSPTGKRLILDYTNTLAIPSLESDSETFRRVFNLLCRVGAVDEIVIVQKHEQFIYPKSQVEFLNDLVKVYKKIESGTQFAKKGCERYLSRWRDFVTLKIFPLIQSDPASALLEVERAMAAERAAATLDPAYARCADFYYDQLSFIASCLRKSALLSALKPYLPGYRGGREIYSKIFSPIIKPNFMYSKLTIEYPTSGEEIETYKLIEDAYVRIVRVPKDIRLLYQLIPPEFELTEEQYSLLVGAKDVLSRHKPTRAEFVDPQRTREIFYSVSIGLLEDLANEQQIKLSKSDLDKLAKILVRYTIGFGLIELLLSDKSIQDIVVNAPVGLNPVSVLHDKYGECRTNVIPTLREAQAWATRLRLLSGRPLDEANPVLSTRLVLPGGRARVTAMQQPLSPDGLAFAFRRHRDLPWTLPLFIKVGMLDPLTAGLLSFVVDAGRTLLIAGTRSAGKTSLLGALMLEIIRSNRIITIEDVLELPVSSLREMGYDIQSMKVRSAVVGTTAEMSAEDGIRTALRLGDSALIIGEVRSKEALALYEAMRIGALAKVVAGTIHGDSPFGVYDRVVNDLGVPPTSFKATDIIIICNPITSPSGLERVRRVIQVAEVRKHWKEDPLLEKGFADLLVYSAAKDTLLPTDILLEGESEILKLCGARVREWAGNWDAIWQNIKLRADIKSTLVSYSEKLKKPELLEGKFVVAANEKFHQICSYVKEELGATVPKRVYSEWLNWLKTTVKHGAGRKIS